MRAAKDADRDHLNQVQNAAARADMIAVLVRIALALERLSAVAHSPDREDKSGAAGGLLGLEAMATHLGVSTRWVQRHLQPSMRSSPRGKAWYSVVEAQTQLACLPVARLEVLGSASSKRRGRAVQSRAAIGVPLCTEAAAVQQRLREKLEKPVRRRP